MRLSHTLLLICAAVTALAYAAPEKSSPSDPVNEAAIASEEARLSKIISQLSYQQGKIELPGGMAHLELPAGYRFLDASNARKVLVELWTNPADQVSDVLGLVLPANEEVTDPDSWAIAVSFQPDGYVSDDDADKINPNELLSQLKEASRQFNDTHPAFAGRLTLEGWAVPPSYDRAKKVLYWAKELSSTGSPEHTLNYDVRVLGRRGVLSMNAVASMHRLSDVSKATPQIVSLVHFNPGHSYADYNSSTDKKADYTLAGLVVGGVIAAKLAKTGLIATILLGGKKFIALIVVGVAALGKKLFGRKSAA